MPTRALAIGQTISGNYRVLDWVGAGGMGEIYEAAHTRLAGRYAIKILHPEIATASDAFARFQREARVTSALQHPNIVHVVDFSAIDGGPPYLVMEFLDGPELAQVIKRSGPLPLSKVTSYVKQIASGLMAAHENDVVHRDLKPQNIFVLQVVGHDDELIKIVDFGISKVSDATAITSSSGIIGTARYMSPEQARGLVDEIDARTDQFSLAVITYEMLTGQTAFKGDSISSLLYQIVHEEPRALAAEAGMIAPAVAAVLKRALAKNKEQRFPTIQAFALALEEAATARPTDVADTAARPSRTSRRGLWLAASLAALIVVGGWLVRHASQRTVSAVRERPAPPAAIEPKPAPPPRAPENATPASMMAAPKREGARVYHRPKTEPERPPAVKPSPAEINCNPTYYLDAHGDKHFKPECFLDQPSAP
jgi:serine/threonine protein kinase